MQCVEITISFFEAKYYNLSDFSHIHSVCPRPY